MRIMRLFLFLIFFVLCLSGLKAQHDFEIDASNKAPSPITGQLHMGDSGQASRSIVANNQYLTIGSKPVLPVMGEVHFSRLPRSSWEDVILKMKANGVSIIACYVLWIHHEELEGQFNWDGNRDLRAFVSLCGKHGLMVYPRIGPWCHAEVRNGGTPDWLLAKKGIHIRSNDPEYQHYVELLFQQIAGQLKGLLYKDGGPVIGVQLENEYRRGVAGEAHIRWLKKTAIKCGLDVPLYTVTGWGNASVPAREVIPLWGAYPDEPWATNLNRSTSAKNFQFSPYRNDDKIGNEKGSGGAPEIIDSLYPYFTCEMGVGVENTDHRRLQIGRLDGEALMMAKLGSGSNLIGYYMFAGGSNPHGTLASMEETQLSGSWNTNPAVSYDFQAAIRESGELGASYAAIKPVHYFLRKFGTVLAPMTPVFTDMNNDFQYSVRSSGSAGFLFAMNYCRHQTRKTIKAATFNVRFRGEQIKFPSRGIDLPDSSLFIWPLNLKMDDLLLKYATAMPIGQTNLSGTSNWIFASSLTSGTEFCFDDQAVRQISCNTASITHKDGRFLIHDFGLGRVQIVRIRAKDGRRYQLTVLSKDAVNDMWMIPDGSGQPALYLSKSGLYNNNGKLHVYGIDPTIEIQALEGKPLYLNGQRIKAIKEKNSGLWRYRFSLPIQKAAVKISPLSTLGEGKWIKARVERLTNKTMLYKNLFLKRFQLKNTAPISSATMYYAGGSFERLLINNRTLNQGGFTDTTSRFDLTGYLKKGDNAFLFNFLPDTTSRPFAAHIVVRYANNDREDFYTDSSWLNQLQYTYPSYPYSEKEYEKVTIVKQPNSFAKAAANNKSYRIHLYNNTAPFNNFLLSVRYVADKARLYKDGVLVADDFYDGCKWNTSVDRIGVSSSGDYLLTLSPLKPNARKYFDAAVDRAAMEKTILESVQLKPVYQVDLSF